MYKNQINKPDGTAHHGDKTSARGGNRMKYGRRLRKICTEETTGDPCIGDLSFLYFLSDQIRTDLEFNGGDFGITSSFLNMSDDCVLNVYFEA